MSTLSWWRSWHGAPMDNKWPVIAARSGVKVGIVSAVAWALMDYASQHKVRGTVEGFDTEVYSIYSGFSEVEVVAVIQAMTDKGIIVDGKLANWEKRQPKREDNSAPRVAKFRAKKKDVTQGNASNESVSIDSVSDSVSLSSSVSESVNSEEFDEFGFPIPAGGNNDLPALSHEFEKLSGRVAYRLDEWRAACQNMASNNVTPEIMQEAIDVLKAKKYTVSGPWSIEKTAIGLVSDRQGPQSSSGGGITEDGRIL
jgi:hypothetical protein